MRRSGRTLGFYVLLMAFFLSTGSAWALVDPAHEGFPQDFDRRTAIDSDLLSERRGEIAEHFTALFGDRLTLHWGDWSERPLMVLKPGTRLGVAPLGEDPVVAARDFLRGGSVAIGLSSQEIDALDAAKVYFSNSLQTTHVQFLQRVDGISVFRGHLRVNMDTDGGILNVGGEWFPGLRVPYAARISAEDALHTAVVDLGLSGTIPALIDRETDGERMTHWQGGEEYLSNPQARLVLLPLGDGRSALTWEVVVQEATSGWDNMYLTLIDARSGDPILRKMLTLYMNPADAVGDVFDCENPDNCGQTMLSLAGDPVSSPDNWVFGRYSIGNNTAARVDWNGNNGNSDDGFAADGGTKLEFLFPFTDSLNGGGSHIPDRDAAITNGLYWGNVIHDHWYSLGFDEAAGNYQDDNFGNGGLGGDHVNVDLQDSANLSFIRNNANWGPTNDGTPPRTNYFLWTNPDRDGAFDAGVIWHEYGHGITTRLVGGPSVTCLNGAQGGGMGEGWGDWFGVHYFSSETHDPVGPVVVGAYVTGNSQSGIRRFPYSYDMNVNAQTYADLCNEGCQVHRDGEIWAQTLWDVRHDLIAQHGYSEGFHRAEQIVIDGMKLSPCSPNMVTMRDLILQANEQVFAGEDTCLLRGAFARRGLGAAATSNGTGADATADFSLVQALDDSISFDSKTALVWNARSDATAYGVARGDISGSGGNLFDDATCQGEVATAGYTAAATPAVGQGFYFVVAVRDDCDLSGYGMSSSEVERSVTSCP
jgi:hypothetical protein